MVGEPAIELLERRRCVVRGRWMVAARKDDSRVLVHRPMALPEEAMVRVDRWGEVAFIAVPNRLHRLDNKLCADRYPDAKIVTEDP